jgi:glutamate decarboxylase
VVFRVVLANPLTTDEILREVLDEQLELAKLPRHQDLIQSIRVAAGVSPD